MTPTHIGDNTLIVQALLADGTRSPEKTFTWQPFEAPVVSTDPASGGADGQPMTLTFRSVLPDTKEFRYSLDFSEYQTVAARPDGTATVSFTPQSGGGWFSARVAGVAQDGTDVAGARDDGPGPRHAGLGVERVLRVEPEGWHRRAWGLQLQHLMDSGGGGVPLPAQRRPGVDCGHRGQLEHPGHGRAGPERAQHAHRAGPHRGRPALPGHRISVPGRHRAVRVLRGVSARAPPAAEWASRAGSSSAAGRPESRRSNTPSAASPGRSRPTPRAAVSITWTPTEATGTYLVVKGRKADGEQPHDEVWYFVVVKSA